MKSNITIGEINVDSTLVLSVWNLNVFLENNNFVKLV